MKQKQKKHVGVVIGRGQSKRTVGEKSKRKTGMR